MNIIEVSKGMEQGKKYQLPEWWRFYMFSIDNAIYVKSQYTEPMIYNLHNNELTSDEWVEFSE